MNLEDIRLLILAVAAGIIAILDILILLGKRDDKDEDEK